MLNQSLRTAKGERIAIVSGLRTPFARRDTGFKDAYATSLGTMVTNELLSRTALSRQEIDQLVFAQVIQQPDIPNPAREIALASTTGIAGGADSISNAPLSLSPRVIYKLKSIFTAETLEEKYRRFRQFSWRDLKLHGVNLKDFTTQMSVAELSEQMAQQHQISREAQDEYARHSNEKALNAWKVGLLKEEVMQSCPRPYTDFVVSDTLTAAAAKPAYYQRFSPLINKLYATVTEANMPQPTDGAAAVLLMNESKAKALGYTPLGYIRSYAITGNDIWQNMFAGATIASSKALTGAGLTLKDMDLIDIHETSASQMLMNIRLFEDNDFAKNHLNRTACLGEINQTKLNHLGGSIAFGNPRAVTSLRTVIQSLHALKRQGGGISLVASSGLGGQGAAMVLETE